MCQPIFRTILCFAGLILMLGCQPKTEDQSISDTKTQHNEVVAYYQGILESTEYDSIVNQLTLYQNETFELHQVDRIAEHRLHDREHKGIYAFLNDSTQMGLYAKDGTLMLRFQLSDSGINPLSLGGERISSSNHTWRRSEMDSQ